MKSAQLSLDDLTITATGTISGSTINWSNSTSWTRTTFDPPALSHAWTIGAGRVAQLDPNDGIAADE